MFSSRLAYMQKDLVAAQLQHICLSPSLKKVFPQPIWLTVISKDQFYHTKKYLTQPNGGKLWLNNLATFYSLFFWVSITILPLWYRNQVVVDLSELWWFLNVISKSNCV